MEQRAHLLFFEAVPLHTALILKSCTHLFILLETHKHFLFISDAGLLLGDHVTGQRVHEVLSAGLTSTELTQPVILLLVQHLTVFLLSLHISTDLVLFLGVSRLLVCLVLTEHFLEVFLLLATLFLLEGTLHFHLLL